MGPFFLSFSSLPSFPGSLFSHNLSIFLPFRATMRRHPSQTLAIDHQPGINFMSRPLKFEFTDCVLETRNAE